MAHLTRFNGSAGAGFRNARWENTSAAAETILFISTARPGTGQCPFKGIRQRSSIAFDLHGVDRRKIRSREQGI
jgi:hypothetical protein